MHFAVFITHFCKRASVGYDQSTFPDINFDTHVGYLFHRERAGSERDGWK